MAKVNPIQKSAANPHEAWVITCKEDGQVMSGHCTCMAGWVVANLHLVVWVFCIHWIRVVWLWLPVLTGFAFSQILSRIMLLMIIMLWFLYCRRSEVCSHVAAVLLKAEEACRLGYNKPTCTSLPCSWNQSFSTKVMFNYQITM